jgi:signal peptidase I
MRGWSLLPTRVRSAHPVCGKEIGVVRAIAVGVARMWLWLGVIAFVAFAAVAALQGGGMVKLVTVQTDSMRPVMQPGDLLLDQRMDSSALQVGDIVTADNPVTHLLVTHRVTSIDPIAGGYALRLKGDANEFADGNVYSVGGEVFHPVMTFPGMGAVVGWADDHRLLLVLAWVGTVACALLLLLTVRRATARNFASVPSAEAELERTR